MDLKAPNSPSQLRQKSSAECWKNQPDMADFSTNLAWSS
jgi:hypothetical protein